MEGRRGFPLPVLFAEHFLMSSQLLSEFPLRLAAYILGYVLTALKAFMLVITAYDIDSKRMQNVLSKDFQIYNIIIIFLSSAIAMFYAMQLCMSVYLLVGLYMKKLKQISKFWKFYTILLTLYFVPYIMMVMDTEKKPNDYNNPCNIWKSVAVNLTMWLIEIYTIYIVYRLVIEMKIQSDESQGVVAPTQSTDAPPRYCDLQDVSVMSP